MAAVPYNVFAADQAQSESGYFGRNGEPSFAAKYHDAPDLPATRSSFERFARSVGLAVAEDLPGAGACINQTTETPPGPEPAACGFIGRLKTNGRDREAYVVFYDHRAMAYAVMTHYEYTGP
jgi:hypothetical protein